MPKVSIITPVYNVEKYLERCLDSVLAQTFTDFEVICINDGSPDNSGSILDRYAKKDHRIKIVTQENQGVSIARNNGLKEAKGDFIYFLDSDDFIHNQLLELTYELAIKHNADLVEFDFIENKDDSYDLRSIKEVNKKILQYIITNKPIPLTTHRKREFRITFVVWTKLYKKELIQDIEFIPHIHFEDYPHIFITLSQNPTSVITNIPLYYYTNNKTSITSQAGSPKQIQDYKIGINFILDHYQKRELKKELIFLENTFLPEILSHAFRRCKNAPKNTQPLMWDAFSELLQDLNSKKMMFWKGLKRSRYLAYKKILLQHKLKLTFSKIWQKND